MNNSGIVVKWKCLKLFFHQSKCVGLTANPKNWYIWNSFWTFLYLFLYIHLVFKFSTQGTLSPVFSGINNNNLPFLLKGYRENIAIFLFVFTALRNKMFLNIFSIDLILFQVIALSVSWLPNQFRKHCQFQ